MSVDPSRIDIELDPLSYRMRGSAREGKLAFDVPYISHIDGNLWSGGCANGLVLPENIENLVSLYPWEQYTVKHELQSMLTVRAIDHEDQPFDVLDAAAAWALEAVRRGPTLIHCQAGLNRSGYVAARVLMTTLGLPSDVAADGAIETLRIMRSPACLSNKAFERHLRSL